MRLADQWRLIHENLPPDWESVRLVLTPESVDQLDRVVAVVAPMGAGRRDASVVFDVRRAGGAAGPEAAVRLLGRLDDERVWGTLTEEHLAAAVAHPPGTPPAASRTAPAQLAGSWDATLETLPPDWSDLLCELSLESSDLLDRAALLCAPVNPTRERGRVAFTFRCARVDGYGVSPMMARRCLERLDEEGIAGAVRVLRVLSDTEPVYTQGPVWYVGGRVL